MSNNIKRFLDYDGVTELALNIKNYVESEIIIESGEGEFSAKLKGSYKINGSDYENNAISSVSTAIGAAVTAGLKGWYYTNVDLTNKKIWLSDKRLTGLFSIKISTNAGTTNTSFVSGWKEGDEVTIVNGKKYERCATILAINGNMITLDKLPFDDNNPIVESASALGDYNEPDEFSITALRITDNDTFKTRKVESYNQGFIDFGGGAHAEGIQTYAVNIGAHAEGIQTVAYGQYSHTEGFRSQSGYSAHAEGRETLASGAQSHAEGRETVASGVNAHAEGRGTTASGTQSHAEGYSSTADGEYAHAEGRGTTASGAQSHAEGYSSTAVGEQSHAEGYKSKALQNHAHAEGNTTTAEGAASHAEGRETLASNSQSHAEGRETIASGVNSHAEGYKSQATVFGSHAEGIQTTATGSGAHAEGGYQTESGGYKKGGNASGVASHAEGVETVASGMDSHAEGYMTQAINNHAHAEGHTTIAEGGASHAEGRKTHAFGNYSHAEGRNTLAHGDFSHAEGCDTYAEGAYSHAEGHISHAKSAYTHAGGYNSIASGDMSFAHGTYVKTTKNNEVAFGKYNVSDENTLFSIGAGESDTDRSNIFEICSGVSESDDVVFPKNAVLHREVSTDDEMSDVIDININLIRIDNLQIVADAGYSINSNYKYYQIESIEDITYFDIGDHNGNVKYLYVGNIVYVDLTKKIQDNNEDLAPLGYGYNCYDIDTGWEIPNDAGSIMEYQLVIYPYINSSYSIVAYLNGSKIITSDDPIVNGNSPFSSGTGVDSTIQSNTNSVAYGTGANSFGSNSIAYGHHSHIEGRGSSQPIYTTKPSKDTLISDWLTKNAEGTSLYHIAAGDRAHVEGLNCLGEGSNSHAEGQRTRAQGVDSHAEGRKTHAVGIASHAGGVSSISEGISSFAHGDNVKTTKDTEVAFGKYNVSDTSTLFSLGNGTTDSTSNAFSINSYTDDATGSTTELRIGDNVIGNNNTNIEGKGASRISSAGENLILSESLGAFRAVELDPNDKEYMVGDMLGQILIRPDRVGFGVYKRKEGTSRTTNHSDYKSKQHVMLYEDYITLGDVMKIYLDRTEHSKDFYYKGQLLDDRFNDCISPIINGDGSNSILVRNRNSVTLGSNSSSFGSNSFAYGKNSFAEGGGGSLPTYNETTTVENLVNEWLTRNNQGDSLCHMAIGARSHIEGLNCLADGSNSHAEGQRTRAQGVDSHAEGRKTHAVGNRSHAGGESSISNGDYSFAHGNNVKTTNDNEVAFGKYNVSNNDTVFSIGAGTAENNRSNILELKNDKTLFVGGKRVLVEGNGGQSQLNYITEDTTEGTVTINAPLYLPGLEQDLMTSLSDLEEVFGIALVDLNTKIENLNTTGGSSNFNLITEDTANSKVTINGSIYADAFFETSDERLKIFTNPINVDLDKLAELRKSYFTYIEAPGTTQIGVSAQEIQKLYPEIVSANANGYLTVDYSKLSVIALKAVDELNKKNKDLEARLERLEKMLLN